jgi:hypothetical protein
MVTGENKWESIAEVLTFSYGFSSGILKSNRRPFGQNSMALSISQTLPVCDIFLVSYKDSFFASVPT